MDDQNLNQWDVMRGLFPMFFPVLYRVFLTECGIDLLCRGSRWKCAKGKDCFTMILMPIWGKTRAAQKKDPRHQQGLPKSNMVDERWAAPVVNSLIAIWHGLVKMESCIQDDVDIKHMHLG